MLLTERRQQHEDWKSLIELLGKKEERPTRFPVDLKRRPCNSAFLDTVGLEEALDKLGRNGKEIPDDLVVKNDKLIERVIQLLCDG